MAERLRLGELLVETGLITQSDLEIALDRQKTDKRRLGELLVDAALVSEAKVTQVLSQQLSVPWVSLAHIDFSRALLDLVPSEVAERYGVVPIYVRRGKSQSQTLYIAMQDPTEEQAIAEVAQFSGLPVRAMIAPPGDIRGAIRAYYLGLPPEEGETVESPDAPVPAPPPPPVRKSETHSARPELPDVRLEHEAPIVSGLPAIDESEAIESRDSRMPRPKADTAPQKMVTLTLLDGTQITLPASSPKPGTGEAQGSAAGLTARDLVEALRAHASGADVSEVLGENMTWERLFAALLSVLLKKHLIVDWEFVREIKR